MTKSNNRLELYIGILLAVSLVAVALRTIALFLDFDVETNYFNSKVIINIANIFLALGALFLFSYAFFSDSKKQLIASFTSPATFAPTTIVVVALVYFSLGALSKAKSLGITFQEAIATKDTVFFIWIGLFLLSLLSTVYFVLNAVVEARASILRATFGLAAVLFFALYSAQFFFNTDLQLNAPNKVVDQLAYLFAALFFLYEIRISLGRECWNLYVSFGFISAPLLAYSAFPTLIYYIFTGVCVSASIFEVALTISLFLFVTSRLVLTASLTEEKLSSTVMLIKESFERKIAYLDEKEPIKDTEDPKSDDDAPTESEPKSDTDAENGKKPDVAASDVATPHYDPEATAQDEIPTPTSDTEDTQ